MMQAMTIMDPDFLELSRDLDAESFWAENSLCTRPGEDKPRCALASVTSDDHWLFSFLGVVSTLRYYRDKSWRDDLHRQANALMWEHLRVRAYDEDSWETAPKRIENLFGCEFAYHEGGTPWFVPVTSDPAEFARILDRAEAIDIESWCLPEAYLAEWERRKAAGGKMPHLGTGSRGPATVITSVLDPQVALIWCIDEPELMDRFTRVLTQGYLRLARRLRAFSGCAWNGWWITDDNCCLFNPKQYRRFCMPVLRAVLEEFAPLPDGWRYQHSDSAMAHHLDAQRELGIGKVNYGPEIDPRVIRARMPEAVIDGHLPPFLLRNGSPEDIRARVRSDFAAVGAGGRLNIATAGSIPAGTGLGRLRWLMRCVRDETRYR
jgi:uroporphyrinogen decarboxylase